MCCWKDCCDMISTLTASTHHRETVTVKLRGFWFKQTWKTFDKLCEQCSHRCISCSLLLSQLRVCLLSFKHTIVIFLLLVGHSLTLSYKSPMISFNSKISSFQLPYIYGLQKSNLWKNAKENYLNLLLVKRQWKLCSEAWLVRMLIFIEMQSQI